MTTREHYELVRDEAIDNLRRNTLSEPLLVKYLKLCFDLGRDTNEKKEARQQLILQSLKEKQ